MTHSRLLRIMLEADVGFGDDAAADQRRREFHDGMPAHGHDVGLSFPGGTDEDDGAWFEKAADVGDGKIFFGVGLHLRKIMEDGVSLRKGPGISGSRFGGKTLLMRRRTELTLFRSTAI